DPGDQRLHPRGAAGEPGGDDAGRLEQHVVRSSEGGDRGGGAAGRRGGRDRPAPGHVGAAGGGGAARARDRQRLRHGTAGAGRDHDDAGLELGRFLRRHRAPGPVRNVGVGAIL
ncbi:MAG: hypothetical protein AVDCRST_MAG19-2347, partial [uncultured Thermomicrobiales bacterium]